MPLVKKWERQSYSLINQMFWDIFLCILIILSGIFLVRLIKRNSHEKDQNKLSSELQSDFEKEFEVSDSINTGDDLSSLIDWIEENKEQDQ